MRVEFIIESNYKSSITDRRDATKPDRTTKGNRSPERNLARHKSYTVAETTLPRISNVQGDNFKVYFVALDCGVYEHNFDFCLD